MSEQSSIDRPAAYARWLRLRHIHPGALWCLIYLEGSIVLAVVLSLAEVVGWWGIAVIPVAVAAAVKLVDLLVGRLDRVELARWADRLPRAVRVARGRAAVAPTSRLQGRPRGARPDRLGGQSQSAPAGIAAAGAHTSAGLTAEFGLIRDQEPAAEFGPAGDQDSSAEFGPTVPQDPTGGTGPPHAAPRHAALGHPDQGVRAIGTARVRWGSDRPDPSA